MKKIIVLLTLSTLSGSAIAEETSWFDSLKSLVGLEEKAKDSVATAESTITESTITESATVESTKGLVETLTSSLGVNTEQASGGMGAIFNYVKNNVSTEQFGQLAQSVPSIDSLVNQMPDMSKISGGSSEGLGGLLDKASEYSDSLKAINTVKNQFESLGLDVGMISSFVSTAKSYLDTEQGQEAKKVLTDGLGKLLG